MSRIRNFGIEYLFECLVIAWIIDSVVLSSKNKKAVLVPPSFLNGHLVLSKEAVFFYKWSYPGEYPDVNE